MQLGLIKSVYRNNTNKFKIFFTVRKEALFYSQRLGEQSKKYINIILKMFLI